MQSQRALRNMKKKKQSSPKSSRTASRRSTASSTSAPAARSSPIRSMPSARFSNGGPNSVVIRHTEFFDEVVGDTSLYGLTGSYPLQPGLADMFPWLSRIAPNYETYRFRHICFRYRPRCPSITPGLVGMVFDFDALDGAPQDQMYALSYHDKGSDGPWKDIEMRLDLRSDRLPVHYTRAYPIANGDLKTYDLGNLFVFTSGVGTPAAPVTCGILEIDYEIELFTPQLEPVVGGTGQSSVGGTAQHLVGSDFTTTQGCPVRSIGNGVLEFVRPFEGLVNMTARVINALSPPRFALTNDGGKGSAQSLHYGSVPNDDGNNIVSSIFRIIAPAGARMDPFLQTNDIPQAIVSMFDVDFGSAKYSALQ